MSISPSQTKKRRNIKNLRPNVSKKREASLERALSVPLASVNVPGVAAGLFRAASQVL